MGKSRKNSIIKNMKTTATEALPAVDKGLTKIGTAAKDVAKASIPVVEKGASVVYDTMATGLDLGVKGVKSISKRLKSRQISRTLSRGRKLAGGRSRRHRRRMSRHHKH
jgi:NaMN:DMB phosphoribosyltransferase